MYNLIEHSDIYWKTPGSLYESHRRESVLDNDDTIIDLSANNNSVLYTLKKSNRKNRNGSHKKC